MAQATIDLFAEGSEVNRKCPRRQGNVVYLPDRGSLVVAGDLHGHQRNFERIVTYADLAHHPDRHVVLQEIIHGGPQTATGGCLSYTLLLEAIRYKLHYPDQVHLIMGNHDTAYITGAEVMKDSREMNRALSHGLETAFGLELDRVETAFKEFLLSQPLAVKTENCLWVSHSLPSDRLVDQFDAEVLNRELTVEDCDKPGSVYLLTWGRRMSQSLLNRMAQTLGAEAFILGHQSQPEGWARAGDNLIILASEHNHGCFIHINLDGYCNADHLEKSIKPLSSIL